MIPQEFLKRMQGMLGEDYPAFLAAMTEPSKHALRVNRHKTDAASLLSLLPFAPEPLPFTEDGFLIRQDKQYALLRREELQTHYT